MRGRAARGPDPRRRGIGGVEVEDRPPGDAELLGQLRLRRGEVRDDDADVVVGRQRSDASREQVAAVDDEDVAGDEAGGRAGQELHGADDLGGVSPADPWVCAPARRRGARGSAAIGAVIGVSMTPGATALTRMPSSTQWRARLPVSVTSPALADP